MHRKSVACLFCLCKRSEAFATIVCLLFVLDECLLDDVAQKTCLACHQLRQLGCRRDALQKGVFEVFHKRDKTLCVQETDLISMYLCQTHRLLPLAVFVEVEIQIVGEDDVSSEAL